MKIKTFYRDTIMDVKIERKDYGERWGFLPVVDLKPYGIYLEAGARQFLPNFHSPFKVVQFENEAERKEFGNMLLFYRKQYQESLREAKKSPCFGGHKGAYEISNNGSGYSAHCCDVCGDRWNEDSGD